MKTKQELAGKIEEAKLLSQKLKPEEIETLDPATRMLVARELLARPPNQGLNREPAYDPLPIEQLKRWVQPRPTRVPMRQ